MALIPPFFADCVVAFGANDSEGKQKWIGSGFIFGRFIRTVEQGKGYRVFLVSNKHVFAALGSMKNAFIRINPKTNEPGVIYNLEIITKEGKPAWFGHPNHDVDIALTEINFALLQAQAMQAEYLHGDDHSASISKMNELGVTEGDFIYALGFPMGLVGEKRNSVIVRTGVIARIRDTLAHASNNFLIDCSIFPGNSGGPVVLKPEIVSIQGTKSQNAALLIGIVSSYVPYQDVAISVQTNRPRVVFEENSGLAEVIPVDFIEETITAYLKSVEKAEVLLPPAPIQTVKDPQSRSSK